MADERPWWPDGLKTTEVRVSGRKFSVSLAKAVSDLEDEIEKLNPDDWKALTGNNHTKSNGMPLHNASPDDPAFALKWTKDGDSFAVGSDEYRTLAANVREA